VGRGASLGGGRFFVGSYSRGVQPVENPVKLSWSLGRTTMRWMKVCFRTLSLAAHAGAWQNAGSGCSRQQIGFYTGASGTRRDGRAHQRPELAHLLLDVGLASSLPSPPPITYRDLDVRNLPNRDLVLTSRVERLRGAAEYTMKRLTLTRKGEAIRVPMLRCSGGNFPSVLH